MSEISISGWANPHAKRLYDDLLSNYNRLIRPVENNTEHLTVKLGLKLSQLIDVVSTKLHYFISTFTFLKLINLINTNKHFLGFEESSNDN